MNVAAVQSIIDVSGRIIKSHCPRGNFPLRGTKPSLPENVRVLIADDEKAFADTLAEMVRGSGHEVVDVVYCGLDAIRSYRRHRPHVVLLDLAMSRLNGLTACRNILSGDPAACIFFLSALRDRLDLASQTSGARGVLQKPIEFDQLRQLIEEAKTPSHSQEERKIVCA